MPFFKVDDALHSHPKAVQVGDEALGMWVRAGTFSMAYGTDGFVPLWWVKQQPKGLAKAKRLVGGELWHPADPAERGESGFMFHQWRQDTKEKVEADREKARQRKAKSRESHQESRRDIPRDTPCDERRTPGYVPITHTHTQEGGGVTNGSHHADALAAPTPFCPKHPDGTDEPCRACKRCREAVEAETAAHAVEQQRKAAVEKAIRANCPTCHGTNWVPDSEPALRCYHEEMAHA